MLFLQQNPEFNCNESKASNSLISGSGEDVGLPDGQMGNSEVGHMNLGAGRVLYQDFTRITKDIRTGAFEHEVLVDAVEKQKQRVAQFILWAYFLKVVFTHMKIILWRCVNLP